MPIDRERSFEPVGNAVAVSRGRRSQSLLWLQRPRALALAGFLALSWSTPAAADYYGAIAFSQDSGAHGYSNDFGTRGGAERRARDECGDGCEVVLWFKNACGAIAVGENNGYGTGWASERSQAEDIAMSNCNSNAAGCGVLRWVCTSRD